MALCDISLGTADGQRIGHQITLKSLHINVLATHADPTQVMRVLVFQHFPEAYPLATDIFQDTSTAYMYMSPYNFDNSKSFRILYDSTKLLDNVAKPQAQWNKYINLTKARKNVEYQGSTTDGLNRLYMLVISDSTAISHPAYKAFATLTYTDA